MKILLVIFAALMLAFSCNESKKSNQNTSNNEEVKTTNSESVKKQMWAGTISKAEVTSYQYGTHQLKGNALDGNPDNVGKEKIFALKSDKINLDEWIGKKVILTGNMVEGYPVDMGPDFIDVEAIEADGKVNGQ